MCPAFLIRSQGQSAEALLGHKKRGFEVGRIVGLGGYLEANESARQAAVREIAEESGVQVEPPDLSEMAQLVFHFPARPNWDQRVSVFTAERWRGQPAESEKIAPEWFGVQGLPFERMWDDARLWLPQVLAGQRLSAEIVFGTNSQTVGQATLLALK